MAPAMSNDQAANGTSKAAMSHHNHDVSHRPCPPHSWGCPVVMKVDPRSVAWTCAGCGAIATAPVGDPPPTGASAA
jgi:hypothetical protein